MSTKRYHLSFQTVFCLRTNNTIKHVPTFHHAARSNSQGESKIRSLPATCTSLLPTPLPRWEQRPISLTKYRHCGRVSSYFSTKQGCWAQSVALCKAAVTFQNKKNPKPHLKTTGTICSCISSRQSVDLRFYFKNSSSRIQPVSVQ